MQAGSPKILTGQVAKQMAPLSEVASYYMMVDTRGFGAGVEIAYHREDMENERFWLHPSVLQQLHGLIVHLTQKYKVWPFPKGSTEVLNKDKRAIVKAYRVNKPKPFKELDGTKIEQFKTCEAQLFTDAVVIGLHYPDDEKKLKVLNMHPALAREFGLELEATKETWAKLKAPTEH